MIHVTKQFSNSTLIGYHCIVMNQQGYYTGTQLKEQLKVLFTISYKISDHRSSHMVSFPSTIRSLHMLLCFRRIRLIHVVTSTFFREAAILVTKITA